MAYPHSTAIPVVAQDEDYTDSVTLLLSNGGGTLIDVEFFEWACQWDWNAQRKGKPSGPENSIRPRVVRESKGKRYWLSREIMLAPKDKVVDHVSRCTLDNREKNLRVCTQQQNTFNKGAERGGRSKFKGVSWDCSKGKWRAACCVNGKITNLGTFHSEEDAALAYNDFARQVHGEFAYQNAV